MVYTMSAFKPGSTCPSVEKPERIPGDHPPVDLFVLGEGDASIIGRKDVPQDVFDPARRADNGCDPVAATKGKEANICDTGH